MNAATLGDKALEKSDLPAAIKHFTDALIELPRAPTYYVKRATAYSRRKAADGGPDFAAALRDAELALALARERGKRELIIDAQMRRAVALFQLERYGDASYLFDILEGKIGVKGQNEDKSSQVQAAMAQRTKAKHEQELTIWKIKIKGKLSKLSKDDEKVAVTIQEYPDIKVPSEQELRKNLKAQASASTTSGIVEELPSSPPGADKTKESKVDVAGPGSAAPFTAGPGAPSTSNPPPAKVRHEWYQSQDSVVVTVYAKGVKKDELEVDLQNTSLSLGFPLQSGSTFAFTLDPLYAPINTAQSKVNVLSTKIEITLRKQTPGQKWSALESLPTAPVLTDPSTAINKPLVSSTTNAHDPSGPAYPTSSRHGVKNWDKLASDLTSKKKKDKGKAKAKEGDEKDAESDAESIDSDYGAGDPVDGFFKKLYANADEDTRRAMMKSYLESEGTALSTNWDEVGKEKVAIHPPSD